MILFLRLSSIVYTYTHVGTCESGDVMSSDSDTNLEVMSVTEEYGEKEREEDIEEEDLPMTQQVDPKPLAGMFVCVCVCVCLTACVGVHFFAACICLCTH